MFEDRKDAGQRLAGALSEYRNRGVLVLAIPRGGAEVGFEVAKYLNAQFSLIVSRKLPFPDNPESGFGAIAEDGSRFIYEDAARWVPEAVIERIALEQGREIARRIGALRGGRPLPEMGGRVVILVDDGIAMGSTMRASIMLCRNKGAKKIVVAAPVAGADVAREIRRMVDDVVILESPRFFQAVAQVYRNWYDLSDEDVFEIMSRPMGKKPQAL
jgi:predicted phosphoribosyltransferase